MVVQKMRSGATYSPKSLQTLAVRATLHLIEEACKSPKNLFSTENLRKECAVSLPWLVRQHLIEELLKSGRIYNTLQLYVFDVLLTQDIRRLAVRYVRRFYRNHFIDLLSSGRVNGLEVLLFEDMTWVTGSHTVSVPLAMTFSALPNLRQVSLRFVCDDIILTGLGMYCPNLHEIDMSGSLNVTDAGLQQLCLKTHTNLHTVVHKKGRRKSMWRPLKHCLQNIFLNCCLETALDDRTPLPVWWRSSLIRRAKKNSCCDTLRIINVMSTSVTSRGIEFLHSSLLNAKVLTKL